MSNPDRRDFLKGLAATGAAAWMGGLAPHAAGAARLRRAGDDGRLGGAGNGVDWRLRVYVLVLDGLEPTEVSPLTMPALASLRARGTWYEQPRASMVAETLPNHVAMMTGAHAERNGVPGNSAWLRDWGHGAARQVSNPDYVTAETLFETIHTQCPTLRTAAIQSKTYLHEIFGGKLPEGDPRRPHTVWEPGPVIIPVSNHTPDNFSFAALQEEVEENDPDFAFVNLGDIDRSGHADPSGAALLPAFRRSVMLHTDAQLSAFVNFLVDTGRWDSSVLIVVSDHGMDYSLPLRYISLTARFEADPDLAGRTLVSQNGTADLIYLRDPWRSGSEAPALLKRMREVAAATEGVHSALYRVPNPADPGHVAPAEWGLAGTERAGELVASTEPEYRFSEPQPQSNPIPGNHGGVTTRPSVFLIVGGAISGPDGGVPLVRAQEIPSSVVDPGATDPAQARNIDVAPTVAMLFGLAEPTWNGSGQYQGRALEEAFNENALGPLLPACAAGD